MPLKIGKYNKDRINIEMCKYCEKKETGELVDLIQDSEDLLACIGEITPISKRKHPDCQGELYIEFDSSTVSIPIKYCPMCGRKL